MQDLYQDRQQVLIGVVIIGTILLIIKCFQIQVWDKSYQQQHSYRRAVTLYPSRGLVYDRNNKLLVYNSAMYDLMATYNRIRKSTIDTAKFCHLLDIDKITYQKNLNKDFKRDKRFSPRKPFEFLTKIPAKRFALFEEHLYQFPGFEKVQKNVREYPINAGGHILGYISEVNAKQIDRSMGLYQRGDYAGASGLEHFYEPQLRGRRGVEHILKDKWGRRQGKYKDGVDDIPAQSGFDLVTSLDADLQRYGEKLLQNKTGAIVAIEPSTGEILALVSAPAYDPGILVVGKKRKDAFKKLQGDTLKPLFNRATMAKYPPGSIFKPILAAIALQEKVLTPYRGMACRGGYIYGPLRVGCHGHGATSDVGKAIQYSCNNYFCQTFREVVNIYGFDYPEKGLSRLVDHLYAFGLGKKLGVDIPNEQSGHVPTVGFFNRRYGKNRWKFSHFVSIGIGQGEIEITPIQMANLAAIVANRGYYYIPHFAKEFKGDTSSVLDIYKERHYTKVHPKHFDIVVKGMEDVILAGTGRRAAIPGMKVCGKTGTVENPHGKDHSTFIAFAPKDNPKIAVAVYVENGGYGSTYAAPIASLIIEKYLKDSIQAPQRQYLEDWILKQDLVTKRYYSKDTLNR
ncbi:MAG: penicillin-binding protein 2 [Aureispira sp.]|nr:penicillin-binding protein 2 [Aureispira sp.]